LVSLDEIEYHEETETEKRINAWRQSQRQIMIDIIQDLIQTSHKYAKSHYTPGAQRARWTKLAGQLIWYKDQILKNYTLEAMTIDLNALKKQVIESEKQRERESHTRNFPLIGFRKPEDKKAEDAEKADDGESSEPARSDDPEDAKENA
jgi:hypothetical protein